MKLGLDVSTTKVGIAVLNENDLIICNEVLKLNSSTSLEARAEIVNNYLREISDKYREINDVYVEDPIILYQGNAGQAKTTAILQRFNGMVCYIVRIIWGQDPFMVNAVSARSRLGIKIVKKRGSKPRERKQLIIDHIQEHYSKTSTPFNYEFTKHGNFQPGTDDRADALVVVLGGPILREEKKLTKLKR